MQIRLVLIASLTLATMLPALADEGARPAHHANGEHPAVLVARQARTVDTNTYLVQPPATAAWTVQPEAKLLAQADASAQPAKAGKAR